MSGGAVAGVAAAHAAAVAQATRASGAIVKVAPEEFQRLVSRSDGAFIVTAYGGWPSKRHQYLTNYRGLFLYCKSEKPLQLPTSAEVVQAKSIWVP
jgi:hypothetical protein